MDVFTDKVVAISGAASGLGRALACQLSRRGASLAICDVDEPGLADTARMVREQGGTVFDTVVDVADREQVGEFAADTVERFGVVHQIYNNAGLAHIGAIEDVTYDEFAHVMDVDFWGVVHGTKEFLPYLIESGQGHVVNISSVFGLVAAPRMAAYDAAKFAVRGFTEALRAELIAARRPVRVTSVHPGGIRTSVIRNAASVFGENKAVIERRFGRVALTSPDGAARSVLRGVAHGKGRVLVGPDAYGMEIAYRLAGTAYERVAALAERIAVPARKT
jgi:NAD(P)-dependent dehydrogenase (short-subunit alcohol dehydrogenase family)